jgi:hypothetical protein
LTKSNLKEQETPEAQQPLTQKGKRRCTQEEHIKWWKANSLKGKKLQRKRTIAKRKRLGKPTHTHSNSYSQIGHGSNIWNVNTGMQNTKPTTEQRTPTSNLNKAVFTRRSDPFKAERVDAVLSELTIGDDLTKEQWASIENLLCEFTDCFALSMSEVTVVAGATHKLNVADGTKFKKKVNQRPLSGPQKEYFNGVLDKMLEAGIIAPIDHNDVKCCGQPP